MNPSVIFPGQGAQFAGMGHDWAEAHPAARRTFDEANEALGFSLTDKIWPAEDGDAQAVNRTDLAQPGILTTSAAIINVMRDEHGLDPAAAPLTCGLSLGEYTALWFAGSLTLADAVRLVRLRGEAMQDASESIQSSMTSLMGATPEQAEALAKVGSEHGICSVANINAPGQIVVSGEIAALDAVEAAAKEHGVRRARRLVVAGGFHSECMRPAADRLKAALGDVELKSPQIPFLSNVTAGETTDPDVIREQLSRQVCAPVLWEASMREALGRGIREFLEPGPGTVLAGIMKKIDGEVQVRSAARPQDLASEVPS